MVGRVLEGRFMPYECSHVPVLGLFASLWHVYPAYKRLPEVIHQLDRLMYCKTVACGGAA